ncbi:Putative hemolysin [Monaibacterium marinum]|uniref:L-ornithine N(alpha)-acyltransferase n=1 Tax=Pontivivens marinum TaxID=1690039 RepID=A0A2C9CME7_9RHOB|nr:GNAT family N-acetyltransferase [Monaibacterium marinum]SOH92365.1 Putative hemolysin [Monaibacterium marinum]
MKVFRKGRYRVRFAQSDADIVAAQRLRFRTFRGEQAGVDADDFDKTCIHVLIEEERSDTLVCCYRLMPFETGTQIGNSYSAQYYELDALAAFPGPMVEMGRFCIDPDHRDPDILRIAWGAMVRYVDDHNVELLFGCSSFHGVEAEAYMDAFDLLRERHLAPKRWLPRVKAPSVFRFGQRLHRPDLKKAMKAMPPLLRTYLLMGGWVSDHAVVDKDMNTLHVFTGLEIKGIPPVRQKLLRASSL